MSARTRSLITALIVLAASLALSASASAAEEVNVTGTWQAVYQCQVGKCAGQERNGVFTLSQAAGSSAVTGTLNLGNGELAAPVSGTVSGSVLNLEGKGTNGYSASGVETISSNGLSWSGTYKDSVGTSGTLTATRPSLPVFAAGETEPRAAAIQVLCNYEVAPANFTCTASVGDASGLTPSKIPTGTVSFTAPSGSFTPLPKCALVATPGSTDVASCSVTYTPATKIPTGTSAPVTGAYSGDTTFAPSAAKSGTGAVVSPIVKSAKSTGEGASTTVSCPTGPGSCTVTVALTIEESGGGAIAARKAKRRKLTIGSTAVTVKGGQQSTVAVKLNQAGKRLLARHKRFTAMLSISSHGVVIKSQKVALKLKK